MKNKMGEQDNHAFLENIVTTIPYDLNDCNNNRNRIFSCAVSTDIRERIVRVCKNNNLSIYTLFLTCLKILLLKYTAQKKINIISPIYRELNQSERIYVILEDILCLDSSFKDTLYSIKKTIIKIYNNQSKFKDDIQDNISSKIMLCYDELHEPEYIEAIKQSSKMDLIFLIKNQDNQINLSIEYAPFYQAYTIETLSSCLIYLIKQVTETPDILLRELKLTENEDEIIKQFNFTDIKFPTKQTINKLFENVVSETPEAHALHVKGENYTYYQLNKRTNQIAHYILQSGIEKSNIIAIFAEPTFDTIAAILGIMKAGCIYLPINPDDPDERISYILNDSNAACMINGSVGLSTYEHLIYLNNPDINAMPVDNPEDINNSDSIAYIIYTSGSTAQPKGVPITHNNVIRLLFHNNSNFEFGPNDIWTLYHSFCFDFSVWEMYGSLLFGGKLLLVERSIIKDPLLYYELVQKEKVTVLNFTPVAFYYFMQVVDNSTDADFCSIRYIIFGGEKLDPRCLREWIEKYPKIQFINMYGITEITVHATYKKITHEDVLHENSVIGVSLPTTSLYVLSDDMKIMPKGMIGEIYIGGYGLSKGYLNRPEQSASVFLENPFEPGETIYKSGDYGRINSNGDLEYIGRRDMQIKIRGFRMGVSEIEQCLLRNEKIAQVMIMPKNDSLCAYIVPAGKIDLFKLKEALSKQLPQYMIPDYFYQMESFPLTTNGKIDRKRIIALGKLISNDDASTAETEIEYKLSRIFMEILKIDEVYMETSFFDVGGNSLKAVLLSTRIQECFNVECPVSIIFDLETVRAISKYIENGEIVSDDSIIPLEYQDFYEVSAAQRRIYFLSILSQHDQLVYNIPTVILLRGFIDSVKIEHALNMLIERHEILSTSFHLIDGEIFQKVNKNIKLKIHWVHLNEEDIHSYISDFMKPFDLTEAPLFRVSIVQTPSNKLFLVMDIHHIICDGTSSWILIRDFLHLYAEKSLPKLTVQYKDYAKWQNNLLASDKMEKSERYWLNRFSDVIPVLAMNTDYKRTDMQKHDGDSITYHINGDLYYSLKEVVLSEKITLFSLLLTVFYILLMKHTGQNDIIIGSPASGRTHADIHNLVGLFLNILPLRNYPNGNKTLQAFLQEVNKNAVEAIEHQNYQYDYLITKLDIDRNMSRNPLFDAFFILQNYDIPELNIESFGLEVDEFHVENKTAKFDITLQAIEYDRGIELTFEYCSSLFKKDTIQRMLKHYINILNELCRDIKKRICDINILSNDECEEISKYNETLLPNNCKISLKEMLEQQAEKQSNKIAVTCNGTDITYHELNRKSNQLAHYLFKQGVVCETLIAIYMDRSIDMIIAMLAVVKVGGAYLPIDSEFPDERVKYMIEDSNVSVIIKKSSQNLDGYQAKLIDVEQAEIYLESDENLEVTSSFEGMLYTIYTSGSSGKPKGIIVQNNNMINFIEGLKQKIMFQPGQPVLNISTISFDIFVVETFYSLVCGSKIVIADDSVKRDINKLMQLAIEQSIEVMQITPTMLRMILDRIPSFFVQVPIKLLLIGGEMLSQELADKICQKCNARIYNMYGPTETTVWCSIGKVQPNSEINIGYPIANTKLHIFDENNRLVPIGVSGELYISGEGVGRGYINNQELTAESFKIDYEGLPVFKTGDIAKRLSDGSITILGRCDNQIKIRGNRIELEEIENTFMQIEGILDVAVIKKTDHNGYESIVAFYKSIHLVEPNIIRAHLRKYLLEYMIPSAFYKIDEIPVLPNGKKNRKLLENDLYHSYYISNECVPANKEMEKILLDVWMGILAVDNIGITDDFFHVGGHSLSAIKFEIEMEKRGIPLKAADIFIYRTVQNLVLYAEGSLLLKKARATDNIINKHQEGVFIQGIQPFNDVFYLNCFYNSLFSVIKYMNRDVGDVLVNTMITYNIIIENDSFPLLNIDYVNRKDLEEIFSEMEILYETTDDITNILNWVKNAINLKHPIIVWIDGYYEPLRKDSYRQMHVKHTLVVYGYNDDKNIFYVIEHTNADSLDYKYQSISYDDFIECCEGYIQIGKMPLAYKFFNTNVDKPKIELKDNFLETFSHQYDIYEKNTLIFKYCMKEYISIILDQDKLSKNIEKIVDVFNHFINAKRVDKYRFELFKIEKIMIDFLNDQIENAKIIRNALTKMMFTKSYKQDQITQLIEKINWLVNSEQKYYELWQ